MMTRLALLVVFVSAAAIPGALSASPPSWYQRLQHFGPLRSSGWAPRPMTPVAGTGNFTISGLDALSDAEFMFVSLTADPSPGSPPPPLGPLNWKQGKIGVGALVSGMWDPNGSGDVPRPGRKQAGVVKLIPGGGAGRYPAGGVYTLEVDTARMVMRWTALLGGPGSWIGFAEPVEVSSEPERDVIVGFTEPVRLRGDWLRTANAEVTSPVTDVSAGSGLRFAFRVRAVVAGRVSELSVAEGGAEPLSGDGATSSASRTVSFLWVDPSRHWTGATWGPLHTLRDDSGTFRGGPDGGWYVTPIHANYVPSLGKVLFSGWLRRDGLPCAGGDGAGGRRRAGVTFLMDPIETLGGDANSFIGDVSIDRVDEDALLPMETADERRPPYVEEGQVVDGDVIYCAGHTTLDDESGSVFLVGGGRYAHISSPYEYEWGLDYARIFNPATRRITRVEKPMPLGASWYPTAGRLPDGRVIVTGAFTAYATENCLGDSCVNSQVNIFDPRALEAGGDPWTVLLDADHADDDIAPGIREYTRVFPLPVPVRLGRRSSSVTERNPSAANQEEQEVQEEQEILRDVLLLGKRGRIVLASTDPTVPMGDRFVRAPNGTRPGKCVDSSDQSTAVIVADRGGEIVIAGGCTGDAETMRRVDIYNVATAQWRSFGTGIARGVPASAWLPDGRVLLVSGEDPSVDQVAALASLSGQASQVTPRTPIVFDPETGEVFAEAPNGPGAEMDAFRGYHNTMSLLRDGSVVVGGGFEQYGDVGCENPNARLFRPSYLSRGPRPVIESVHVPKWGTLGIPNGGRSDDGSFPLVAVHPGTTGIKITVSGDDDLHPTRAAALLAVQGLTHSYGQNGRYVRLTKAAGGGGGDGFVEVDVPDERHAMPGHYHLFLVSASGVPSIAAHVWVVPHGVDLPDIGSASGSSGGGGVLSGKGLIGVIAGVSVAGLLALSAACILIVRWRRGAGATRRERLGSVSKHRRLAADETGEGGSAGPEQVDLGIGL